LYVGSGGNEVHFGEIELIDKLYLNDGKGNFTFNSKAIPRNATNTAVIAPYDYDNDGDLDLFVGSRSYAMEYGKIHQVIFMKMMVKVNLKTLLNK